MTKYKIHFRLIALVLTLAILVQVAPMRFFVTAFAEEPLVEAAAEEKQVLTETAEESNSAVVSEIESLRSETTKHFRLRNGNYIAVSYGLPVHYQDEDGNWQDIDNTLALAPQSTSYRIENGDVTTAFAANLSSGHLFSTQNQGTSVSMTLKDIVPTGNLSASAEATRDTYTTFNRNTVAKVSTDTPPLSLEGDSQEKWSPADIIPKKLQSSILYEDVFPNVDLRYTAYSYHVKEEIIVNAPQANYSYDFHLSLDGVVAVLNSDGSVSLVNKVGKELYYIPAPFMQDSAGAISYDAEYTLSTDTKGVTLTVTADADWMNDPSRVYPVSIDPTLRVQNSSSANAITVTYGPSGSENPGPTAYLGRSPNSDFEEYRTIVHLNNLPDIPAGSIITDATLSICLKSYTHTNCPSFAACAYETSTNNTIDASNMIDYAVLQPSKVNSTVKWNLTETITNWYSTGTRSGRFMLKTVDGTFTSSSYAQASFDSNPPYSNRMPLLLIEYRSTLGIEPYYTYTTLDAGTAGTAYIADNSGQLKVVKEIASYASTSNPFSLSLVYNSDYFTPTFADDTENEEDQKVADIAGLGWTMNWIQTLNKVDENDEDSDLVYLDGDGTKHYFIVDDVGTYHDEDGLGLRAKYDSPGVRKMFDLKGNNWYFTNGLLTKQVDNNGNIMELTYSSGQLTQVKQKNNANGTQIIVATLTYSENKVSTVTDAGGNVYTFVYSGELLTGLKYNNTTVASYQYSGNRITRLTDSDSDRNIQLSYNSAGKVSQYKENDGSTDGAVVSVIYHGHTKTTYHDHGIDRASGTGDDFYISYAFDSKGRTINTSTVDYEGEVWAADAVTYIPDDQQSPQNNHIAHSASMNVMGMQYMKNGGLENPSTDESLTWAFGTGASPSANARRTGQYGIEGTISLGPDYPIASRPYATNLSAGYTYTVSAYVNTSNATFNGTGMGLYLTVRDAGNATFQSNRITYSSSSLADNGWVRISVPVTPTVTGNVSILIFADGFSGNIYLDDFFIEYRDVVSEVNLLENGFAQYLDYGWTLNSHVVMAGGMGANVEDPYAVCFKLMGVPMSGVATFSQTVPINLSGANTFVLSGWGLVNAVPSDPADSTYKKCGLIAEVVYTDQTIPSETFYAPFDPYVEGWQFISAAVIPSRADKTVKEIVVTGTYAGNANVAYFDSLSLVLHPTQKMTYDNYGNLTSVETVGLKTYTRTYADNSRNITRVASADGVNYTYEYSGTNNLEKINNTVTIQEFEYDTAGNVTSTTLSNSNSNRKLYANTIYTSDGNRIFATIDPSGIKVEYSYETNNSIMWGLPTKIKNKKNVTQSYNYDNFGRITQNTVADAASLVYNYSGGNLTKITRTNTLSAAQIYEMDYDGFGNMTQIRVGTKTLATYTYGNRNGLLQSVTAGNGDTLYYQYDNLGRVTSAIYDSGKGLRYKYNGNGQLESMQEAGYEYSVVWRYTYDTLGRVISSAQYNPFSFLLNTAYSYDANNRLVGEEWTLNGGATYSNTYHYDDDYDDYDDNNSDGRLVSVVHATGQTSTYSYDNWQRLSSISSGVHTRSYTYRDLPEEDDRYPTTLQVSNLRYQFSGGTVNFRYTYDTLGNISSYYTPWSNTVTYTYDDLGQLTKAAGDTTYTYEYDSVGNILEASNGSTTHTYTYGNADWKDLLTKFDGVAFTYDNSGNPTSYYNGTSWTFTWGDGKKLMGANASGKTIVFSYNEDGSRASKTVNGTRTDYIYNGSKVMRETSGGVAIDFIYDADGRPFAMKRNGAYYYYILNLQGDVIRLINSNGATVASYEYDPYGKVISATGSMASINPLRYRGYYYDQESGMYFLQSRYYDPAICRFINADNFASTGQGILGYNMFAYCRNNPVNMSDSSGHWPQWFENTVKVASAVIAVAAVAATVVAVSAFTAGTGSAAAVYGATILLGAALSGINGAVANESKGNSYANGYAGGFISGGTQAAASRLPGGTVWGGTLGTSAGTAVTMGLNNLDPDSANATVSGIATEVRNSAIKATATSVITAFVGTGVGGINYNTGTLYGGVADRCSGLMPSLTLGFGEGIKAFFGAVDDAIVYIWE